MIAQLNFQLGVGHDESAEVAMILVSVVCHFNIGAPVQLPD